ncbi:MAG: PRC-barrel domain-containing protein [Geminicoccaceae bacterium]
MQTNDTMANQPVDTDETSTLISSSKVDGTAVYDPTGDRIGSIDSVMIEKRSGQVNYAVLSFGGFLGMGNSYHPLPWKALKYDTGLGGYVVDVDRGRLENSPSYGADESPDWADRSYGRRIDDYYGYGL